MLFSLSDSDCQAVSLSSQRTGAWKEGWGLGAHAPAFVKSEFSTLPHTSQGEGQIGWCWEAGTICGAKIWVPKLTLIG